MVRRQTWIHILVFMAIAGTVLACYAHTFDAPFVFDDKTSIVENRTIRDLDNFLSLDLLTKPRPLTDLTFALNYAADELEVFGYHLLNISIHIVSACLVYVLALLIFLREDQRTDLETFDWQPLVIPAAFAALVFALHPIQTQAVTYIVQRYTSMAGMFYLGTVVCYILGRQAVYPGFEGHDAREAAKHIIPLKSAVLFVLCLVCGIAGFLSKQSVLSLPAALLLVEYALFDWSWTGWKRKALCFLPFLALFLGFVLYSTGVLHSDVSLGQLLAETDRLTRETEDVSRWHYLLTQFQVIPRYMGLLVWPVEQNADYLYPFVTSLFQDWTIWGLMILLITAGFGLWFSQRQPVIFVGIFWFFIALSVESSLIPIKDAMFEHRLYLPMFGFALIFSRLILIAWRKSYVITICCMVCVLAVLGVATHERNKVWLDEKGLWEDVISKNPENYRAYTGLGLVYESEGNLQKAMRNYNKALSIDPEYAYALLNIGSVLGKKGKLSEAEDVLRKGMESKPKSPKILNNLGVVVATQHRFEEAKDYFQQALKYDEHFLEASNNLGLTYYQLGQKGKALHQFRLSVTINPQDTYARKWLTRLNGVE